MTEYWWIGTRVPVNGNLANTHRKNVMFGLIRKVITCSVRHQVSPWPRSSFERRYVLVKEIM